MCEQGGEETGGGRRWKKAGERGGGRVEIIGQSLIHKNSQPQFATQYVNELYIHRQRAHCPPSAAAGRGAQKNIPKEIHKKRKRDLRAQVTEIALGAHSAHGALRSDMHDFEIAIYAYTCLASLLVSYVYYIYNTNFVALLIYI